MAATTSHRVWEMDSSAAPASRGQLPSISALTSNLPAGNAIPSPTSTRERDSGAWSSQPHSNRSSAWSTGTSSFAVSSNTNSYYMSPQRISSISNSSQFGPSSHASADYSVDRSSTGPLSSPGLNGPMSLLPSLNQVHDPARHSQDFPQQGSRRSSIGSQVNQGFGSLHINGTNSPYSASVNHSSTSLAQNLSHQRGIPSAHGLRNSRSSAQLPMSPPASHAGELRSPTGLAPRIAPPIGRNPRSDVYSGHEPVPGQAYAFPDADDMEPGALPPKSRHGAGSAEDVRFGAPVRRGSGHTSLASSVVTSESRLPIGQHRLDEAMPGTHHHSLQQSQMSDVIEDESMTPEEGTTPYSRTPALRVSHKMAERKRRSEMKDLFENLRSQIPSNQGSKSSKWEILMKASDYIKQLETQVQHTNGADKQLRVAVQDLHGTRRDNDSLRDENQRLMHELRMLRQQQQTQPHPPPPPPPSQTAAVYPPQHYVPPPPPQPLMHDPSRSLPPLTNGTVASSSSMDGVRYSNRDAIL